MLKDENETRADRKRKMEEFGDRKKPRNNPKDTWNFECELQKENKGVIFGSQQIKSYMNNQDYSSLYERPFILLNKS